MAQQLEEALLRVRGVQAKSGKSRSALYGDIAKGLYVAPVKIGARACAWPASEVQALVAARIRGENDDAIRALVSRLEADRRQAA